MTPTPQVRGRPRRDPTARTVPTTVRMTPAEREKFYKLGASQWLIARLHAAKDPR